MMPVKLNCVKGYGGGRYGSPGEDLREMDLLGARLCLSLVPLFGVVDNNLVLSQVHFNCCSRKLCHGSCVEKHNVLCSDTG